MTQVLRKCACVMMGLFANHPPKIWRNRMIKYRNIKACSLLAMTLIALNCVRTENPPPASAGIVEQPLAIRMTPSPAGGDSREPEMTAAQNGSVILSWVEKIADKRYALNASVLEENGWSETRTVAEGENWFVNWADFPSVIALKDGTLAAHWLVKSGAGTYAYDVNISMSRDAGRTWSKPLVPHRDNTQTEHGFVSLVPLNDGRLGAIWLDGRNMKNMKENGEHNPAPESMMLRYAAIDANGNLGDEAQLDDRVC